MVTSGVPDFRPAELAQMSGRSVAYGTDSKLGLGNWHQAQREAYFELRE